MGANELERLKQEIEAYRRLLELELASGKRCSNVERVIELSRSLDKLIVEYEQILKGEPPK